MDSGLGLPRVACKQPRPIPDTFVAKIIIEEDGKLMAGGVSIGRSYELLAERVKFEKADTVVLLPHADTPWKHVYWAIKAGMKGGAKKVGFGLRMGRRDAMLLLPLPDGELELDPEIEDMPVRVGTDEDGVIVYKVYEASPQNLEDVGKWAGDLNGDCADMFGGDYARDPKSTPWVFICEPDVPYGEALGAIAMVRDQAIYSMRFGGDIPPPPK